MSSNGMDARDWSLLILLSLLWGAAFILTEVALVDLPAFTVVLGRVGLAALALNILLVAVKRPMPFELRLWGAFLIMGALNNALPFSLIVSGQVSIEGGLAAVLNATTPLFSLVIAHYVTREERLSWNRGLGLLLGVSGVAILIGPEALGGLEEAGMGQLLVLGAALSYACAAIYGRRFRGRSPVVVATGQLTASSLLILPLALFLDRPWELSPSAPTWAALLGISLFGTAGAYIIYFRVLASAGATNLMLVTLLIPPSALLLGWIFLGEVLTPGDLAGAACILLGLLVIDGRILTLPRLALDRRRG